MFLHVVCMSVRYMDGSFPARLLPPTWKSFIQAFLLCPCPSSPTEQSRRSSSSNSAGLPPGSPPPAMFGASSGTLIQELDKKKKTEHNTNIIKRHLTTAPS